MLKKLWRRFTRSMNPPVWLGSALVIVLFVGGGSLFSDRAESFFNALQSGIVATLGWHYVLSATVLLVFVIWLYFSPFAHVRLGPRDAEPDFGYLAWFAMMMSAGMGIGIVFFGAAEPLQHYLTPPGGETAPGDNGAILEAFRFTFFHWGLHPWAIYTAIALPLAYFHFRHDLPLAPRSLLYPLLGERIHGRWGHAVDILCTTGTLFGVATSLGLGAIQINTGLNKIFNLPVDTTAQVTLVGIITLIATISVVTGLNRGIRFLSQTNLVLAVALLAFVFILGPTLFQLQVFVSSIGYYLQKLPFTSLWVATEGQGADWQANWTLFYWSWWISWSPFVGVFVARISRGRTIREFIRTALLVPSLAGFFWFSVFGGSALKQYLNGDQNIAATTAENPSITLFLVLGDLPLAEVTWVVATLLVLVFFVTSSDSGSFVDDMVTSGGHPNPPTPQRVFWALAEGSVAATLLLAGGLQALRSASLTTGLPMSIFLLVAAYGLYRALRRNE